MDVTVEYRKTEVGIIPANWEIGYLGENASKIGSGITPTGGAAVYKKIGRPFVRSQNVGWGKLILNDIAFIDDETHQSFPNTEIKMNDVFLNISGASIGRSTYATFELVGGNVNQHVCIIRTIHQQLNPIFLNLFLISNIGQKQIDSFQSGGNRQGLNIGQIKTFQIPLPPLPEQKAIAEVLTDTDNLIQSLEKQIAKKRLIKQGAMQKLLSPKEGWEVKKINEIAIVLDNLRIPLNEGQREKMKGDIPYCGANGVLDYVNDFVIDDDIILMAEDGGYFDEYITRPIAYRMKGKCWVNNHAHILQAKSNIHQGFLFYSLVHKNILEYISSGTRAKLNKGELVKIEIALPPLKKQQSEIACTLSDIDSEMEVLNKKLSKYKSLKQGLMQNLLTGKIRLV